MAEEKKQGGTTKFRMSSYSQVVAAGNDVTVSVFVQGTTRIKQVYCMMGEGFGLNVTTPGAMITVELNWAQATEKIRALAQNKAQFFPAYFIQDCDIVINNTDLNIIFHNPDAVQHAFWLTLYGEDVS